MGAGASACPRKGTLELEPDRTEKARTCFQAKPGERGFFQWLKEEMLDIYVEKSLFHAFIRLLMHPMFMEYLQVPLFYVLGPEVDKIEVCLSHLGSCGHHC